jgi:hypothetical protein
MTNPSPQADMFTVVDGLQFFGVFMAGLAIGIYLGIVIGDLWFCDD